MWLNNELIRKMHVEKVTNPKLELEQAKKRHAELSGKVQRLEDEKRKLNEKLDANELSVVTEKNDLNTLLEELKMQKKRNMDLQQRLEVSRLHLDIVQDQIDEINNLKNSTIDELKPIGEKLSFKWDVVDCLEKMLVGTRLETAEQDAIITELKKREADLKKEITSLRQIEPGSVSKWQEQFLDARLKEADVILEFDKMKRTLAMIKEDVEEKRNEEKDDEEPFSIRFNLKDKYQEQIRHQEEASVANTIELQNEVDRLKMQIKKLKRIMEDTKRQLKSNEEMKINLYEVRSSIFHRLQKTTSELERQMENNKKLERRTNDELLIIQENINGKIDHVARLMLKMNDLQRLNEKLVISSEELRTSLDDNLVSDLQEKVAALQRKIVGLKGSAVIEV